MKKVLLGLCISLTLLGCATTDDRSIASNGESQKQAEKSKSTGDCKMTRKKTGTRISRKIC